MGLWFFEETAPFAFSLADEMTAVKAALIARGALSDQAELGRLDDAEPLPPACDVVDLRAVRLSRQRNYRQP